MLKARELEYMISDCGARTIVVAPICWTRRWPPCAGCRTRLTSSSLAAQPSRDLPALERAVPPPQRRISTRIMTPRDAPALIAYTSGSTGTPKGACHSPSDMLASADTYSRHVLAPTTEDVFGGHPTLAFTYGLGGLLVFPLRVGCSAVLIDGFTPQTHARAGRARAHHGAVLRRHDLSPAVAGAGLRAPVRSRSLRYCVSAGEPLPKPVYEEWVARTGVQMLDSLGTTEMFQVFICAQPGRVRPGATGEIVPGYEARIVDDELSELPRGTPGLLAVRGPTGCRYWSKPDRQREYVRGGWNVPNDVCVQDEDGYFWYQCRNDDLIICAGYNIAGPEVEAVLLEHPAVLEAAVVASPDRTKGQVPKAFVVLKPGVDRDAGARRSSCAST